MIPAAGQRKLTHVVVLPTHCVTPLRAGLPVGLQIVGPPGADVQVLAEAAAFEAAHSYAGQVPRDVRVVA